MISTTPQPAKIPTSASKDFIVTDGEILELLPSATFKIKLDLGYEIIGYLAGRMRLFKIKILPGDRVRVEISPYDLKKGRVTYRY